MSRVLICFSLKVRQFNLITPNEFFSSNLKFVSQRFLGRAVVFEGLAKAKDRNLVFTLFPSLEAP